MPGKPVTLQPFPIRRQPDDRTCGPTCLHAVYRHHGLDVPLQVLVEKVPVLEDGGTLGVLLGLDARTRGFEVVLSTWNLRVFDPTWFDDSGRADGLEARLRARAEVRAGEPKLASAAGAYADFVAAGGVVEMTDLGADLIGRVLRRRVPILTGLSATWLYREARQRPEDEREDDIGGDPVGHFVVLTGIDEERGEVLVTDPMHPNPLSTDHTYPVPIGRLVAAIHLGVLTYDANLVAIAPPPAAAAGGVSR